MTCQHDWMPPSQCPVCKDAEIERLRFENQGLRLALLDCATDLQASVTAEYAGMLDYPHMRRKYERDMQPVAKAKEFLGDIDQQDASVTK